MDVIDKIKMKEPRRLVTSQGEGLPIVPSDAEISPYASKLAYGKLNEQVFAFAVALAVAADRDLRHVLTASTGIGDDSPFVLGEPEAPPWIIVDGQNVSALRERPERLPLVNLSGLLDTNAFVVDALQLALARTSAAADAARLVGALMGPELPTREAFRSLQAWTPLLDRWAYGSGAALTGLLDVMRPQVLSDISPRNPAVLQYVQRVCALANLTLFTADAEARLWLADMANHFTWIQWTPTFSLVRERTIWFAACAARSAVAIGEATIAKYIETLRGAQTPLRIFDALFGLSAIGLAAPGAASSIIKEIRTLVHFMDSRTLPYADNLKMIYADAIATLCGQYMKERKALLEAVGLKWQRSSSHGLATKAAMRLDPATFSADGRFLGFAILPTVLETPSEHFYPSAALTSSTRQIRVRDATKIVRHAWLPDKTPPMTMH
jgi:hypothetical protein